MLLIMGHFIQLGVSVIPVSTIYVSNNKLSLLFILISIFFVT